MTAAEFLQSRLDASGITQAEAKGLGIRAMEQAPPEIKDAGPGFIIPYTTYDKKPLKTFRYRRDLERLKGFAKLAQDQPKYLQPPATPVEVYFPQLKGLDWPSVMQDPSIALTITEGELKSIASAKARNATIGLGGVWSWMSTKNEQSFLPVLKSFVWKDRLVYIIYDSDAASNKQVAMAEQRLCLQLREHGALPAVVRLPTLPGQSKTGLDDFLLSEGSDALDELKDHTPTDELTTAIDTLNSEVTYIKNMHEIYQHNPGRFIPGSKFVTLAFANRIVEVASNNRMVRVNVAAEWLKSLRRAEVDDIVFKPGGTDTTYTTAYTRRGPVSQLCINTWAGWGVSYSKKGDVHLFTELLDYFCQGETPEARRWLEQWLAYPVQFPGTKMYSAVVVWSSDTGTGKTLLGDVMGAIYGRGYTAVTHSMLEKSFNGWAEGKQFIMGSEITGNDSRKFADTLKDMVTRTRMHVERKYIDSYEVDDCANYYFTSNHPDAFFLEDKDRRFFVVDASFKPKPASFYAAIDARFLKSEEGKAALMYHLQHVDMDGFSPIMKAHATSAKSTMTQHGQSNVMRWLGDFRNNRTGLVHAQSPLANAVLYTSDEVFRAYQLGNEEDRRTTVGTIGRVMSSMGMKKVAGGSQVYLSDERRVYLWADPEAHPKLFNMPGAQVAKMYEQERPTNKKVRKF